MTTASDALQMLKDGNQRFVSGNPENSYQNGIENFDPTIHQPIAVLHTCSDARVKAGIAFDQPLGKVFITATAGHVSDKPVLASIEYALHHLGTKLVVVMGHSNCGAVKASLDHHGIESETYITSLIEAIQPALENIPEEGDRVAEAVKANTRREVEKLKNDSILMNGLTEVEVVGAYYDVTSGRVEFI